MKEIKIDGEVYYELEEASKKSGLSKLTLKQYIRAYRREELSKFATKIGATLLFSESGVNYINQLRKNGKINQRSNEPITLGGIKFNSKVDACKHFGFTASELSHYIKIKRIEDMEQTQ